jgi:hypothetical protein
MEVALAFLISFMAMENHYEIRNQHVSQELGAATSGTY